MPKGKAKGPSKGKQAAKKPAAKRVVPALSSSDEEDGGVPISQILARIAALEKARSVPPATSGGTVRQKSSRLATKSAFRRDILTRLSALEESAGVTAGSSSGDVQAAGEVLEVQEASGTEQAWAEEGGPLALAVEPPVAESAEDTDGAISTACPRSRFAAGSDAAISVADWRAEACRAIRLAIAPSTQRAYDRAVRQFAAFRQAAGLRQVWPIPAVHLMQFCVDRKGKGLAVKSIRSQLAALAFASRARGLSEATGDFRIRKMLEGWSREKGARKDDRLPISPSVLRGLNSVWEDVCHSSFEVLLFHAAALTAFFGALRVSELVSLSARDTSGRALVMQDLKFKGKAAILRVRRSKTDQRGFGCEITLGPCAEQELCPVRALRLYVQARGESPGVLFCHSDGRPLTKYQFWAVTGRALGKLGFSGVRFATHSFRIGAASTAAAMGYPGPEIQKVGRWRSSAYRSYIRPLP
ncbi:uncharacterized protein LOC129326975 [Eublepharis macularius]|uniref:Uncharacterized protein LOC129326975 n=1 Tax=Eublepharis macularius TaxID=481883 RepID=A0AA97J4B0_EUBMA|nr:uncharacterized protein LOC129326975 [Eublepharis macularius]